MSETRFVIGPGGRGPARGVVCVSEGERWGGRAPGLPTPLAETCVYTPRPRDRDRLRPMPTPRLVCTARPALAPRESAHSASGPVTVQRVPPLPSSPTLPLPSRFTPATPRALRAAR
jgi:hypothetical protein